MAIREADLVVIAPGDLLHLHWAKPGRAGNGRSIAGSRVVIMISNLMNRDRHTVGFTTHKFAEEMTRIIGVKVIRDVLYSTTQPDREALERQIKAGSHPVQPDIEGLKHNGYNPRGFDLVSHQVVVHDSHDPLIHLRLWTYATTPPRSRPQFWKSTQLARNRLRLMYAAVAPEIYALDLDFTMYRSDLAFEDMVHIASARGLATGPAVGHRRAAREATGGSFDFIEYLVGQNVSQSELEGLLVTFVTNTERHDYLYTDARFMLHALRETRTPFFTYMKGGHSVQVAKLRLCGLLDEPHLITDNILKGDRH